MIEIKTPLDEKTIKSLKAGDEVSLSGVIYTARDQAHLRFTELLKKKKKLPIEIKDQVIYYCGPTPPGGRVIGSCGPTTS
ncbi:fumarate hydratase C-terminal domain-containing protein, partial [Candidatus Omnitrophota bacterium]